MIYTFVVKIFCDTERFCQYPRVFRRLRRHRKQCVPGSCRRSLERMSSVHGLCRAEQLPLSFNLSTACLTSIDLVSAWLHSVFKLTCAPTRIVPCVAASFNNLDYASNIECLITADVRTNVARLATSQYWLMRMSGIRFKLLRDLVAWLGPFLWVYPGAVPRLALSCRSDFRTTTIAVSFGGATAESQVICWRLTLE
jgi:hypothetical protein